VPTTRRSRTIAADPQDVWAVVADPYHLARWWPRVKRVEGVDGGVFTEVLTSDRGRQVRADFHVLISQAPTRQRWAQDLEGTPFARVLRTAETEVRLEAADAGTGTQVTLELTQLTNGFLARLGTFFIRRAARDTLDQALDGLTHILGAAARG